MCIWSTPIIGYGEQKYLIPVNYMHRTLWMHSDNGCRQVKNKTTMRRKRIKTKQNNKMKLRSAYDVFVSLTISGQLDFHLLKHSVNISVLQHKMCHYNLTWNWVFYNDFYSRVLFSFYIPCASMIYNHHVEMNFHFISMKKSMLIFFIICF